MQASDYSDVFVSYRRKDVDFTKQLVQALQDAGKEVWIDWEDIPPGSEGFSDDIKRGLEGADAFIAILSPDYLESTYCVDLELGSAINLNKKLIPIVLKKFDDYPIPNGIGHINWIYFTPHAGQANEFDESFQKVLDTLEIDLEYNRDHKRYLLRALDWDNNKRSNSFLLTGDEILSAEAWLLEGASKDPSPTELHTEYIQASRKHASRRQQMVLGGISVALVISIILTILSLIGFQQASVNADIAAANQVEAEAQEAIALTAEANAIAAKVEAERNAEISQSLALASAALQPDNRDIAVALALQAVQVENPPVEAITSLMEVAYVSGMRSSVVLDSYPNVFQPGVSSDGQYIVLGNQKFDLSTGELLLEFEDAPDVSVVARFLPSGEQILIAGDISFETSDQQQGIPNDTSDLNLITMGLYSATDGTLIGEFPREAVSFLMLNLDGTRVAASHRPSDETAIYDIASGEEITRLPHQLENITISDDFTLFAYFTSNDDEQSVIHVADVMSQEILTELLLEVEPVYDAKLAFSPNGQMIVVNTGEQLVGYDIELGEIVTTFNNYVSSFTHTGSRSLEFTPNGRLLVSGVAGESRVNVWDTTTGDLIHSFQVHKSPMIYADVVSNQQIVSLDSNQRVIIWDLKDHHIAGSFTSQTEFVNSSQSEFLVQSNNRINRISLDSLLPTGASFTFPDNVELLAYDAATERIFAVRGTTVETSYGSEILGAEELLLIDAQTGEVITELVLDEVSVDDLTIDSLTDNTTFESVDVADVKGLFVAYSRVTEWNTEFLLDGTQVYFEIAYYIEDETGNILGDAEDRLIWNTQSNMLEDFSTAIDEEFTFIRTVVNHPTNGIFVHAVISNDTTYEVYLLQLDRETREEINRTEFGDVGSFTFNEDWTQLVTYSGRLFERPTNIEFRDINTGEIIDIHTVSMECCSPVAYDPVSEHILHFFSYSGGGGGPISPSLEYSVGGQVGSSQLVDLKSNTIIWDYEQTYIFVAFNHDHSRFIVTDGDGKYVVYRNDTLQSLVEWTCENRFVEELSQDDRDQYGITDSGNVCESNTG